MALADTRAQIIEDALTLVGAKAAEEPAGASEALIFSRILDAMVKDFQATGMHLWSREEATLFLQPGQNKYILGGTTTDNATQSYTQTTQTVAAVAGSFILSLADSSGIALGDYVGVETDDGTLSWGNVALLSPLTLDTPLSAAVSAGAKVYFYTSGLTKPLRMEMARVVTQASLTDTPLDMEMIKLSHSDYFRYPNKFSTGKPTNYYFSPRISDAEFYVWPLPTNQNYRIDFTYLRPLDIFDNSASAPDFPPEWTTTLVYNLAVRGASAVGMVCPPDVRELAAQAYSNVMSWDQNDASMYLEYSANRW